MDLAIGFLFVDQDKSVRSRVIGGARRELAFPTGTDYGGLRNGVPRQRSTVSMEHRTTRSVALYVPASTLDQNCEVQLEDLCAVTQRSASPSAL